MAPTGACATAKEKRLDVPLCIDRLIRSDFS